MMKGNKGDWSELYVFAKLLADRRLYLSDINLNKIKTNFYEIIKAYREDAGSIIEYEIQGDIRIYRIFNGVKKEIGNISIDYFKRSSKDIYLGILEGRGKSFEIPSVAGFIEKAHIKKLTALVTSKSDIKLRIFDHRLTQETDLGFSIKSLLGQDSTLFNTGPGNNFIYDIENKFKIPLDEFNSITYKPSGKESKITFRLKKIINEFELNVKFSSIQSTQLWRNLKMVDGDLPELLSHALLYRWIYKKSTLVEIAKLLEEKDPMNFYDGLISDQKLYEYKLKRFLVEGAMGMTSETPWHGIYDANGGVIICKKDGEIVCFHIYDFNLFRDYLLNNTMFEQPSTGEDEFNPGKERTTKGTKKYYYGWPYKMGDKLYFKINLQIRFL